MKTALAALVAAGLSNFASARDLEPYCWFYAGFDSPAQLAGGAFPQTLDAVGYRESGRYGRAYYFHAKAENKLPPMATFLADAVNFAVDEGATLTTGQSITLDGGMSVVPRHVAIRNSSPWTSLATGFTCSFYAKGPIGTEVSATVILTPLTDDEIAKINKKCTGGDWRKLSDAPLRDDSAETATFAMTGGWRRVQCHAVFDNRCQPVGRTVALRVVTTGGAVEMERFQYHQTAEYPRLSNYDASVWVDGGVTASPAALATSDPAFVKSFPWSEGSFVCWVKCPIEDGDSSHAIPVWGLARSWTSNWGFNAQAFTTGNGSSRSVTCYDGKYTMPREWRHYAGTWKDGVMCVYVDGVLLEKRVKTGVTFEDMTLSGTPVFRCGSRQDGDTAADAMLDDVAIFSTALTSEEVAAIAQSDQSLFAGSTSVLAAPDAFRAYYRNQTNALIRTKLTLHAAERFTVRAMVADETLPSFAVELPAGDSWLEIPFDPSRLRPGSQPYAFRLEDAEGNPRLEREGTLTIRGRRERDAWRLMSWGGSKTIHHAFLKSCDFDSLNCSGKSAVESAIQSGLQPNIRYENSGKIKTYDFDYEALAAQATNDLAYAKGLHDWTATLINSEVYNAGTAWNYTNSPKFLATAREELGCEPEWSFGDGMNGVGVSYGKLGEKVPTGVVDGSHRTYRTLLWYHDIGMPQYRANNATAKVIHEMCPDNVTWSEPIMMPGGMGLGLDMLADWMYAYDPNITLGEIRSNGGETRAINRAYMPTLGYGYYHGSPTSGKNPNTPGTSVSTKLGQSCDELKIKSWMSLAAVRSDHLSIFGADAWEYGLTGAVTWAASPTNAIEAICDLDAPASYGAFVRERLRPAAALLRGMQNRRAPLAFVVSGEAYYAGGFNWNGYHYPYEFKRFLSQIGAPYDCLYDHELNAETLSKYAYVIYPMSRLITAEHDAEFRAAANAGTTFVLDKYATFSYPNSVQLTTLTADYGNFEKTLRTPFRGWYTNHAEEIRGMLPAWSESDFDGTPGSYTFTKELGGVRYVTVVNNARRVGGGVLTEFCTNATYRPYGEAQRITTHFSAPPGSAIYEFNPIALSNSLSTIPPFNTSTIALDYAAAEARVFVVAPRPYASVETVVSGSLAPGGVGSAALVVRDADGNAAAGRQVVRVTLTAPNGAVRDESGDYAVEGDRVISLRFARGEELGTAARPWRLVVRELASGIAATNEFVLTGLPCVNTVDNYVQPGLVSNWDSEFGEIRRGADAASTGTVDRCEVGGVLKAERVYDRVLNSIELAHNRAIDDFRYRELTARVTRNAASYADLGGASTSWTPLSTTPQIGVLEKRHETSSAEFAIAGLTGNAVAVTNGVRCVYEGVSVTMLADDGSEATHTYDVSITSVSVGPSNDCFAVWKWRPQFALDVQVEGHGRVAFDGAEAASSVQRWCDATGVVAVAVAAVPDADWVLTHWRGDTAGIAGADDDLQRVVPMDGPRQLTAVFEWAWAVTNAVTVAGAPGDYGNLKYGRIEYALADSNCNWSASAALTTYADGVRAVKLSDVTRAVYSGWTLTNAAGMVTSGTDEGFLWRRRKNETLVVNWTRQHAVSAEVLGGRGGQVRVSTGTAGLSSVGYGDEAGGVVTVEALPADGWKFLRWLGDVSVVDATKASFAISTEQPRQLKAVFEELAHVPSTCTWSGANGNWDLADNWGGLVPQTGDDVVFADAKTARTVVLTHETPMLKSLVIGAKTTLLVSNWTTCVMANTVTVKNGGSIACKGGFSNSQPSNRIWIVCSDLDVQKGGAINADLAGYCGTNGPAWAVSVAGAPKSDSDNRAASYGGLGFGASGVSGSRCYGSLTAPLDPGSGGGLPARFGGGAIRLDASGDTVVNGTVSANGSQSQMWNGGGASGGAVYLSCRTISGTGTVSASCHNNIIINGHNGGGGGRIAVHYDPVAQAAADCRVAFLAKGGAGSYAGTPSRVKDVGSPGTLWFTDDQLLTNAQTVWRLAGEWHSGADATKIVIPHDVLMDRAALLFVPPVEEVDIKGNLSVTGLYSAVNIAGGKFAHINVSGNVFVNGAQLKAEGASLAVAGDLTLGEVKPTDNNAAELMLVAAPTNAATGPWGCELSVGGTLTFRTNTIAYFEGSSTNGAIPRVTAKHVLQLATATLSADGRGWAARKGPAPGSPTASSWSAGHGGHGAADSAANAAKASVTYGSQKYPLDLGSGANYRGGGTIYVTATDTMRLDGTVTANGGAASRWNPAGAGGSVYLSTAKLLPSTATITAQGGKSSDGFQGFEGGGGRIAIWREMGVTNGLSICAAAGAWHTDWKCNYPATAGTVYLGRLGVDISTEAIANWVANELAVKFKSGDETAESYLQRFKMRFGEDLEAAFFKATGKVSFGGAPLQVWQDYIAGTDPLDEKQQFTALISFDAETGAPVIEWSPKLDAAAESLREYVIQGKASLTDDEWQNVHGDAERYQYFKVIVRWK